MESTHQRSTAVVGSWLEDSAGNEMYAHLMRLIILPLVFLIVAGAASAETLHGEVIGITDGDTLTLLVNRTQHKIRLGEIETPERGQDWGTRASTIGPLVNRTDNCVDKIWRLRYS